MESSIGSLDSSIGEWEGTGSESEKIVEAA